MNTKLFVFFQIEGDDAKLIGLEKEVNFVASPGLIVQQDQVSGVIHEVVVRNDGFYHARLNSIILPSDSSWQDRLNGMLESGWKEVKF